MIDTKRFKSDLLSINENSFQKFAIEVFNYQWSKNQIYQDYCNLLRIDPKEVQKVEDIPFLPIEFFKTHPVISGEWKPEKIFKSSGTTGQRSQHYVEDESFYHFVSKAIFHRQLGSLNDYKILALLPSYLEQGDSSLVSMVDFFIQQSKKGGGFFLHNHHELLESLIDDTNPKILFGVSYALLDFLDEIGTIPKIPNLVIIETGGMKGRKEEITREALHNRLASGFNVDFIYSEYGMTELSSQAYGKNGLFGFPEWGKVLIRDVNDPFHYVDYGTTGGINIIDLANISTVSFVETKDLGKVDEKGLFEVLGRFDNSDLRGCNLLI